MQEVQANNSVGEIPVLPGYARMQTPSDSFSVWLRAIRLKKDNTVYLYNGSPKRNQSAQFAVMDIPVGKKDLQQCADAVMRLRAEYLFSCGRYDDISFLSTTGTWLIFGEWLKGKRYKVAGNKLMPFQTETIAIDKRKNLEAYLEFVFSYCGTQSLQSQLKRRLSFAEIQPGDVLVQGGFPGHAMIVADVITGAGGKRAFMLAQSYMPAQDIHIVKNPGAKDENSPWYQSIGTTQIITPEWIFTTTQLYQWQ